jgi:signal transduction histidine kinase
MPEKTAPSVYMIFAVALAVLSLFLLFIVLLTVLFSKRKNKLLVHNQLLNEELNKVEIEVRDQTLQDVAMEIHDNIGQILTLANLNLHKIVSEDEGIKKATEDARSLIKKSISELRGMSRRMEGENILFGGLQSAIQQQVEWANRSYKCNIEFHSTNTFPPIIEKDERKKLILFRMIQELLNNSLKHSKASKITIACEVNKEVFIIRLDDNGVGFESNKTANSDSLGMKTLKKRAALINASLLIDSTINSGTKITIMLST